MVTVTLADVAVAFVPATWLDTPSPISTLFPIVNVSLPTVVHVTPSGDSYPVIRLPARTSFTQRGAVDRLPAVLTVTSPSMRRRWKGTPLVADAATSMNACAAEGDSALRIITPAFVQALTDWMEATRATIDPSPSSDR